MFLCLFVCCSNAKAKNIINEEKEEVPRAIQNKLNGMTGGNMRSPRQTAKILVLGSGGVGKSSFVEKLNFKSCGCLRGEAVGGEGG